MRPFHQRQNPPNAAGDERFSFGMMPNPRFAFPMKPASESEPNNEEVSGHDENIETSSALEGHTLSKMVPITTASQSHTFPRASQNPYRNNYRRFVTNFNILNETVDQSQAKEKDFASPYPQPDDDNDAWDDTKQDYIGDEVYQQDDYYDSRNEPALHELPSENRLRQLLLPEDAPYRSDSEEEAIYGRVEHQNHGISRIGFFKAPGSHETFQFEDALRVGSAGSTSPSQRDSSFDPRYWEQTGRSKNPSVAHSHF